jgi:hypothetical protein
VNAGVPKDIAASVHQRLLNRARASHRPFNELLQYYALERFLYRLSASRHADGFVLKGSLMWVAWCAPVRRPTKDIDLLGKVPRDADALRAVFADVCRQPVEPDGMNFDPESIKVSAIAEATEYGGIRVRLHGRLGNARLALQVDIGFGDAVWPAAETIEYPTLLDSPAPRLLGYSRESAIAEKLHAMVHLDVLNSRMKDFFDLWLMSRQFDFDGRRLAEAISATFARRGDTLPALPLALTGRFADDADKAVQWRAFLEKSRIEAAPPLFSAVVADIARFLKPVTRNLSEGRVLDRTWKAGGPWMELGS